MAKISKWSIALAGLLSLLVFAGTVHPLDLSGVFASSALTSCGVASNQNPYDRVVEWAGLSLVALMVGLMWAIIGQVLGGTFGGPKYNEFVKGMIWGGIETAALLGLFTALFIYLMPV